MAYKFPEHFWWGAASSAFQIEGGWNEGGKGMTVADYNSLRDIRTRHRIADKGKHPLAVLRKRNARLAPCE